MPKSLIRTVYLHLKLLCRLMRALKLLLYTLDVDDVVKTFRSWYTKMRLQSLTWSFWTNFKITKFDIKVENYFELWHFELGYYLFQILPPYWDIKLMLHFSICIELHGHFLKCPGLDVPLLQCNSARTCTSSIKVNEDVEKQAQEIWVLGKWNNLKIDNWKMLFSITSLIGFS